jgi:hypothetical protein
MSFLFGLKNDSLADDAGIEPHKILGLLGAAGLVGKTYYVDSTHSRAGATQRHGTRTAPFSKLAWAITNLSAANLAKATFILLPGHAETITENTGTDCDVDVAGINIIGVGTGTYQPTITVSSASGSTGARMNVSAANVSISNVCFTAARDSLARFLYLTADYTTIDGCKFVSPSALECLTGIDIAPGADYTTIRNCTFVTAASGATSAITITATTPGAFGVTIEHCKFMGNWSNAAIYNNTFLTTDTLIQYNTFYLANATGLAYGCTKESTGMVRNNAVWSAVTGGGARDIFKNGASNNTTMGFVENYSADNDNDTSGVLTPPAT